VADQASGILGFGAAVVAMLLPTLAESLHLLDSEPEYWEFA
jgi:hypothetical protein